MSKKQAKKLGGASASIRAETAKRPVYKSIVGTPFSIQWPKISNELGQTIVDHLIKILVPIGAYRKERKTQKKLKKPLDNIVMPDIYSRIHIGINQVTRYLQKYIDNNNNNNNNNKNSQHVILYVCKRDIKPAQLCQHLLYMAAVANIKLIPMPFDSESKLSNALGMTKTACILVEVSVFLAFALLYIKTDISQPCIRR
ncbi:unnamed protein product [Rhizopus microsporus]